MTADARRTSSEVSATAQAAEVRAADAGVRDNERDLVVPGDAVKHERIVRPTAAARRASGPDDVMNPDVSTYCWHEDGWECAGEFTVHDARTTTRGKAAALYSREDYGDIIRVSVWKRYVRPWTRLDAWEYGGRERYEQRRGLDYDEGPEQPPEDWDPDWESDPVWEFVHRSHPDAIPVWICAERGTSAPQNPRPSPTA